MKRPWNRINTPVYSLATELDSVVNMNICTYVQPISMQPKKYLIALEYGSKTEQQFRSTQQGVLQLLSADQLSFVRSLGHKTGNTYNKHQFLQGKIMRTDSFCCPHLLGCAAIIDVRVDSIIDNQGDHALYITSVINWKNLHETPILDLETLRAKGVIIG